MLDLAGIMFSSLMMLFVIVRAVQMDRSEPWFQTIGSKEMPGKSTARPWQRRR